MLSWHKPQCKVPFPFYIFSISKEQRKSPKYRISTLKLQAPSRKLPWFQSRAPRRIIPVSNHTHCSPATSDSGLCLSPPRDERRTWGPLIMSPALSPRVQSHTTSLKSFRLLSPQEGILFKIKNTAKHQTQVEQFKYPAPLQMLQRHPEETQALLQHSWRPGEISERLLLPHCCPPISSPGSKGMQQGRGQSHTVESIVSMSTWKGKFYFPSNWKHKTRDSLSTTLAVYILLYREKTVWGSTASERLYDSPSFHGKADWICRLQVMSPAVEIQQIQPWLEERVMGRN